MVEEKVWFVSILSPSCAHPTTPNPAFLRKATSAGSDHTTSDDDDDDEAESAEEKRRAELEAKWRSKTKQISEGEEKHIREEQISFQHYRAGVERIKFLPGGPQGSGQRADDTWHAWFRDVTTKRGVRNGYFRFSRHLGDDETSEYLRDPRVYRDASNRAMVAAKGEDLKCR